MQLGRLPLCQLSYSRPRRRRSSKSTSGGSATSPSPCSSRRFVVVFPLVKPDSASGAFHLLHRGVSLLHQDFHTWPPAGRNDAQPDGGTDLDDSDRRDDGPPNLPQQSLAESDCRLRVKGAGKEPSELVAA